jgi:hypothetical protein
MRFTRLCIMGQAEDYIPWAQVLHCDILALNLHGHANVYSGWVNLSTVSP